MKWYTINYRDLEERGYAVCHTGTVNLIFTLRGNCMIDVFDLETKLPIAYLDFDLQGEIILAYAFKSPVIGLPFSSPMRRTFSDIVQQFKDLRSHHEVGLYIEKPYRNKGPKGVWNLDEILMAIAMEVVFEHGIDVFTIKPTGDRARYYRRKFSAKTRPTFANELILAIELKARRKILKHTELVETAGRTHFFKVEDAMEL
jgi:hypothetical protein